MGKEYDFNPFLFPSAFPCTSPSLSTSSSSRRSNFSSSSSQSLNSPFQTCPSSSNFLTPSAAASSSTDHAVLGPCATCKFLHHRCTDRCYLASYFPTTESHKCIVVDKVFGATNIIKFLQSDSNSLPYVPMLLLLRDTTQDGESQSHPSSNNAVEAPTNVLTNSNIVGLGNHDFSISAHNSTGMIGDDNSKNLQLIPFSIQPQRNMTLNSVDSTFNNNNSSMINKISWLNPPPSFQPVRTHTPIFVMVYKSGHFERKIDITRYSGGDELKKELGQMYDLKGNWEDDWLLVFVDHEMDVKSYGNDPWEEFVTDVWYIKILDRKSLV